MGLDEVQAVVVVFRHASTGFAGELAVTGALPCKGLSQLYGIAVTFRSEVSAEDFAAFCVLKILRGVIAALLFTTRKGAVDEALEYHMQAFLLSDFSEEEFVSFIDAERVAAFQHRAPLDSDLVNTGLQQSFSSGFIDPE